MSLVTIIISCLFIQIAYLALAKGFDLNGPPEPGEIQPIAEVTVNIPPDHHDAKQIMTTANRTPRVSPRFYEKVNALFKILEICDTDDFDINKIKLPDSFAAQNKAMLALTKVSSSNLIMEKDLVRFKRVIKNCRSISDKIRARSEAIMGTESEMSGGTIEELRKSLNSSPFDGMRDRFVGWLRPSRKRNQPNDAKRNPGRENGNLHRHAHTTTEAEISDTKRDNQTETTRLIEFL